VVVLPILTHSWDTSFSILTQLAFIVFHLTNAYFASRIVRSHNELKHDVFASTFVVMNLICVMIRTVGTYGIWQHKAPLTPSIYFFLAIITIGVMGMLWMLVPRIILLPSQAALEDINRQLAQQVQERDQALVQLQEEKQEKEKVQNDLLHAQKMEAVGRLTGGIAHDFNNLLMAIRGSLEMIKLNPQSERLPRWTGVGIEAVERAAHLTARLLTFSRSQRLQLVEVKILAVMENFKTLVTRTLGPEIKITINANDDVVTLTDPVQLEMALINLAINARDAMPQGGSLTITTYLEDDRINIDVTDTGTGIPEDVIPRVFEPFFTTKEIGKGTGLGLSMVHGLVNQSKGDVFIKKTSSKGTTITLSLPVVVALTPPCSRQDEQTPLLLCAPRQILLVDDDENVRSTIKEILEIFGHKVIAVEDGPHALVKLKEYKPDLLLVDFAMPLMNGSQVAQAAKTIHSDLNIAFITGYSESAALEGEIVLKKPFMMKDVDQLIRSIFNCG
jgi:signal transduction histidine kinase